MMMMNVAQFSLILIVSIFIILLSYSLYDHVINNDLNYNIYYTRIYRYYLMSSSQSVSMNDKHLEYSIKILRKEIDVKDTNTVNTNNPLNNSIMILPLPKIVLSSRVSKKYIITLDLIVHVNISIVGDDIANNIDTVKDTTERFISQSVSKYYQNDTSESFIDILRIPTIEVIIGNSLSNEYDDNHHDEYYIHFGGDKIVITAKHVKGIRAAIVTVVQVLDSPIAIDIPLVIHDWSDYAWRGLLVDVARHYQPIELLKRCLNAMELAKFNTLHLHLTDSQSFPLLLDDVYDDNNLLELSRLAINGSFSNEKIYTKRDIIELIQYATLRGVTIVPEIDLPAHTLSWNRAFKGIVVNCSITADSQDNSDNVYVLDPSIPLTMKVVKAVIKQISQLFPSTYIHIGGDEVNIPCWEENQNLRTWSRDKNQTLLESYQSFEADLIRYTETLNKVPIVWQGVQDSDAIPRNDTTTIIQPWKCWSNLALRASTIALSHGNPTVLSACMYLDYDEDLSSYLSSDILASAKGMIHPDSDSNRNPLKLLLGGEGSLWTEHVDHTNFECRMWPRAGAIAQLLWGKPIRYRAPNTYGGYRISGISEKLPVNETILMYSSLIRFRNYLISQGLSAAPITFHSNNDNKELSPINVPKYLNDNGFDTNIVQEEILSMLLVFRLQNNALSSYSNNIFVDFNIRISAQCLGIPQSVQRAITLDRLAFAQVNVGEGANDESRRTNITNWMLQKANLGFIGIGLCELNGWQDIESKTILLKNLPKINFRAAASGFTYSHIMVNSQPYNVGYISSLPFEVVNEYGPPLFQRGLLHIFYKRFQLHVMIVHLHAHNSLMREIEAKFIASLIEHILLDKETKVILMGDFNTFSSYDKNQHQYFNITSLFQRTDHEVFTRLKQKYLKDNEINYTPMDILLATGLKDSCIESCRQQSGEVSSLSWSSNDFSPLSKCMVRQCSRTEPTDYDPEWPSNLNQSRPPVRLDFILVSESLINKSIEADNDIQGRGKQSAIYSSIDINSDTNFMSDHYPIYISNKYKKTHLF